MTHTLVHESLGESATIRQAPEAVVLVTERDERISQVASTMTASVCEETAITTILEHAASDPSRDKQDDTWDGSGWS